MAFFRHPLSFLRDVGNDKPWGEGLQSGSPSPSERRGWGMRADFKLHIAYCYF